MRITYDESLRRVPKVELHRHLEGPVEPATFAAGLSAGEQAGGGFGT